MNSPQRNRFVFTLREAGILGGGAVLALACLCAPGLSAQWLPLRIGAAVLLGDFALVWALARDPRTQATLEMKLLDALRGRSSQDATAPPPASPVRAGDTEPRPEPAAPFVLSGMLLFQALSYGALACLLAWLLTGGTQEIVRWLRVAIR
jgi:hypothetical protein